MPLSAREIIALVIVGAVLAVLVAGYMIITRRKGWM